MKNYIYKLLAVILISSCVAFYSCNTFEDEPLDRITDDLAFNPADTIAANIQNYFYGIYEQLPTLHNRISNDYLDSGTDDGLPTIDDGGNGSIENYRNGRVSPSTIGSLDGYAWGRNYAGIRKVNVFLEKMKKQPATSRWPQKQIDEMKAEARFLRAFFYFELLKRWDGIPLVGDQIFDENSDLNKPRSSRQACVDYIISELDGCYSTLPEPVSNPNSGNTGYFGRMNKGTALALKSRLYLYLASPLYNPTNDKTKWETAAQAAKDVIDLNIYSLHKASDASTSFKTLFTTIPNKELILAKMDEAKSYSPEINNSPCGYFTGTVKCKGYTSPSQNLVDAFLTIDGKMIDEPGAVYDPQNPYTGRDPRLTNTIFYNGARWLNRGVETFEGGKDRANRGLPQTQTGYYLRKFLGAFEKSTNFSNQHHTFMIIRYAEILLNYVEALNEADTDANKAEIEKYLIEIRSRAGINPGNDARYGLPTTYTYSDMQKIIRNERRIELAFEEHRFWDIRRWKIAEEVMNQPVKGVKITRASDLSLTYEYPNVRNSVFDKSKMYWYPISRSEMQGNTQMTQNPGWGY